MQVQILMQVTKFIHSCLFIEEADKRFLIDPGNYTKEENVLDISLLKSLDYLLITHEHPDHMDITLIKEVINKFPAVKIMSNDSVAGLLNKEGIDVNTESDQIVKLEQVPHEKVFGSNPPENVMFTIAGKLADPGDAHHFQTKAPVLALPIQAPWGSLAEAVNLAESLRPQVILPIHDWHWNEKAREAFYKRLEDYFAKLGIKFIPLKTGESVNI